MPHRESLEKIVALLEATTTFLGLVAAVTTLVAVVSASLYFIYKRRKEIEQPHLEAIATWFGLFAAAVALLASFCALGYFLKNNQLKTIEKQEQLTMQRDIAIANENTEKTVLKQKTLENENIKLASLLERERNRRLQLEDALYSGRSFNADLTIENLMLFSGTRVIVEWKRTEEAAGLAAQIAYTLQEAKWDLEVSKKPGLTSEFLFQSGIIGVLVRCSPGESYFEGSDVPNSCDKSVAEAADALVREMKENDLRVWRDYRLPVPKSVKVMVGEKENRLKEWEEMRRRNRLEKRRKGLEE